jgi:hypothetical protein
VAAHTAAGGRGSPVSHAALQREIGDVARSTGVVAGARETAVFSGIPITERLAEDERTCGVELATGRVVTLLRFESAVQEVFAVAVLPRRRYPYPIHDDETRLENLFVVPARRPGDALDPILDNPITRSFCHGYCTPNPELQIAPLRRATLRRISRATAGPVRLAEGRHRR